MSFREIQTKVDVENYHNRLINGYPDRPAIVDQIIDQIKACGINELTLAELCVGPGQLAKAICQAFPNCNYVGLDFIQPFLDYSADQIPTATNASFVCADLTQEDWPNQLSEIAPNGRYNVIVSMQSLHDVGGADRAFTIYRKCYDLLDENGIFINADLITQEGDEVNARPGRLTVTHHLELIKKAGYSRADCLLKTEQFGVCFGRK